MFPCILTPFSLPLQYKTPLAVGFFLGVVLMMSQQCLIIFAVFAGRAGVTTLSSEIGADNAVAFFCFVLFMVYGFFAGVLAFFRNDLMKATGELYIDL